jgi:hypothetical protein
MLIHDYDVRIIDAATGELIRHLTIDPTRDYQPRGAPCGAHEKSSEPPTRVQSYSDVLQHHTEPMTGIEPA